jgi:hypothetical protein
MISDVDKDKSGQIDFEEFLDMMTAKMVRRRDVFSHPATCSSAVSPRCPWLSSYPVLQSCQSIVGRKLFPPALRSRAKGARRGLDAAAKPGCIRPLLIKRQATARQFSVP